jgi:hypothetical protein
MRSFRFVPMYDGIFWHNLFQKYLVTQFFKLLTFLISYVDSVNVDSTQFIPMVRCAVIVL